MEEQMDPHVIVSLAPNGIVHVWGQGPVVGGKVEPYPDLLTARKAKRKMEREDRAEHFDKDPVIFKVCKFLGTDPVPVSEAV
jgi:hypothetical protein